MNDRHWTSPARGASRLARTGRATMLLAIVAIGALAIAAGAPIVAASQPASAATAYETTTFWDSYRGWDGRTARFDKLYGIYGNEPAKDGEYPVFIYLVGGWLILDAAHYGAEAQLIVQQMAERGFVAASIDYDNWPTPTCVNLSLSSWSIFNSLRSSAISGVCSRKKADCSKGIAVAGLSHGADVALLGKTFDDRVQAAYTISPGATETLGGLQPCLGDGNRALPGDRVRAVAGESDAATTWSRNPADVRDGLQTLTGMRCGATAYSCLRANGSGWYMVGDGQVEDGVADHCYFKFNECATLPPIQFDAGWAPPAATEWALIKNLDWLQQFVTPGP